MYLILSGGDFYSNYDQYIVIYIDTVYSEDSIIRAQIHLQGSPWDQELE
jgi:hypothetical protein